MDPASLSLCLSFSAAEEESQSPAEVKESSSPSNPSMGISESPKESVLGSYSARIFPGFAEPLLDHPQGHFDFFTNGGSPCGSLGCP